MQGLLSIIRIRVEGKSLKKLFTEDIDMKKVFASAVLALVLVAGTISGVSAAGNGNGAMDGTGTAVCVNEDCANYGENQAATQNRNQVNVSDQNLVWVSKLRFMRSESSFLFQ